MKRALLLSTCALAIETVCGAAAGSSSETQPTTPAPAPTPVAAQPALRDKPADAHVSPQIAALVRMVQSGVKGDVLQAYVASSTTADRPSADEIVYLHAHGVSAAVITTLIQRAAQLQAEANRALQEAQGADAQAAPPRRPVAAPAPAYTPPTYVESYPTYIPPVYGYNTYPTYPYYSYPYYYWPVGYWWSSWYPLAVYSYGYRGGFHRGFHAGFGGRVYGSGFGTVGRGFSVHGGFHGGGGFHGHMGGRGGFHR